MLSIGLPHFCHNPATIFTHRTHPAPIPNLPRTSSSPPIQTPNLALNCSGPPTSRKRMARRVPLTPCFTIGMPYDACLNGMRRDAVKACGRKSGHECSHPCTTLCIVHDPSYGHIRGARLALDLILYSSMLALTFRSSASLHKVFEIASYVSREVGAAVSTRKIGSETPQQRNPRLI
ncbi:hypothetical protein DAEQUDRAFT_427291 [Daedalea quercina L-15889]|uniref:Uncharacterized protein n=1 Tax=Daedalea quercina L-15889 TaxID=1314783 RepID=A0A165NIS6_9APHY|nr:hypothetical protein DAEQUDRAFT_427291 [Daedalea quercina L-15889]